MNESILIVEDDEMINKVVKNFLDENNYNVYTAFEIETNTAK